MLLKIARLPALALVVQLSPSEWEHSFYKNKIDKCVNAPECSLAGSAFCFSHKYTKQAPVLTSFLNSFSYIVHFLSLTVTSLLWRCVGSFYTLRKNADNMLCFVLQDLLLNLSVKK